MIFKWNKAGLNCYVIPGTKREGLLLNLCYTLYFNYTYQRESFVSKITSQLPFPGEHQQPHFPGLTRGLVAVLLYWDGKRCIANSLKALIQSRRGKTWTLELRSVCMLGFQDLIRNWLKNYNFRNKTFSLVCIIEVKCIT